MTNTHMYGVVGALLLTGMMTAVVAAPLNDDAVPVVIDETLTPELEPEVTITQTRQATITSYRIKGQVYLVKIKPTRGAAYYLVDSNGDGVLDMQQPEAADLTVPQWLLFRW